MSTVAAKKEEFSIPSGGIADFYMEDHEIEALEREEAEQEFGSSGIANFEPVARRMASYGRYGDDTVAHVETGELIVPKALINQNPRLKESIFNHLRDLGIDDPERYVVGSDANSINPETGMPEFFLKKIFRGVKRAVSGVAKGVKKAVSSVGKVLKKVAPTILPIALSFTPLGAIYGAALGSGIGTLVQGGSLKDAFKSALIAGGTGALFKGFTGGKGGFMKNIQSELANPMARLSQTGTGISDVISGKGFDTITGGFQPDTITTADAAPVDTLDPTGKYAGLDQGTMTDASTNLQTGAPVETGSEAGRFLGDNYAGPRRPVFKNVPEAPGFFESAKDAVTPGGKGFFESTKDMFFPGGPSAQDILTANNMPATADNIMAASKLAESSAPGFIRTYAPSAALAGTAALAGGFFDKPEPDDQPDIDEIAGPSGMDVFRENEEFYRPSGSTSGPVIRGSQGDYVVDTQYGYNRVLPIPLYADGGSVFPRRVGGIMPNEGIPGKDSVRAMLMPGEFVMTTDAVKGLGNGNNNVGINRMYDLMRGLDAKGKAMA